MDADTIQHVIDVIKLRGINAWWTDFIDDPAWKPKNLEGAFVRGKDTMDVWFDSGTSWTLLPANQDEPIADVYLEGTDQHRGWFQSSLLTHVATQSSELNQVKAPYKTLITHGFTLDSDGRKMSKSLGNVVSPSQIMSGELLPPVKRKKQKSVKQDQAKDTAPTYDAMGSDALRLWAASSDYTRDVTIGQPGLISVNQALHKYRVTFKWLLGVLSLPSCPPVFSSFNELRVEFAGSEDLAANPSLIKNLADRLAFHRLTQVSHEVHEYYAKYEFFKGINTINKYIANDLSAFYFETLKDRIYTGHKSDCQELQKMLGLIFYELLQMLAPICPLLVEEVWDHTPQALTKGSVHPARASWSPLPRADQASQEFLNNTQDYINRINTAIKAAQERLRAQKKVGSSLECAVALFYKGAHSSNDVTAQTLSSQDDREPSNWLEAHFAQAMGADSSVSSLSETQLSELAGIFVVSQFNMYSVPETKGDMEKYKFPDWKKAGAFCAEERLEVGGRRQEGDDEVVVYKPGPEKCPRCWRFQKKMEEELCGRCEDVIQAEGL
jgi:isoleucyl-tRNA synthetase